MAPDYERPAAPVAEHFPQAGTDTGTDAGSLAWQDYFADTTLQGLIGDALANNRDLRSAIQRVESARALYGVQRADLFLGINAQGPSSVIRTRGNAYGHVVLRGGGGRPNYDTVSVSLAEQALAKAKLAKNIVVDCSHANSWKKPEYQPLVMKDVMHQIREGNQSVVGLMIESNIEAGNQPIPADLSQLKYGCSVTDACVGWDTTEEMIRKSAAVLREVLPNRERRA